MNPDLLAQLRCPFDPDREATLLREHEQEQHLTCSRCAVQFPVKQGLPVLIKTEAELPAGIREVSQLPCQRQLNRRTS